MQPASLQPATIIIDEPELGLHPYAITIFAELVKKAAVCVDAPDKSGEKRRQGIHTSYDFVGFIPLDKLTQ